MYIELRGKLRYAFQEIPKDLRKVIGKHRYCVNLKTRDRYEAERRAKVLEQVWKLEIDGARKRLAGIKTDPLTSEAQFWRETLKRYAGDKKTTAGILGHIANIAHDIADGSAFTTPEYLTLKQNARGDEGKANEFFGKATGKLVPLTEHLDEYLSTAPISAKTADMRRAVIERFAKRFPYHSDVARKEVQGWINGLAKEGIKGKTLVRILSDLRGYWKYLRSIEVVTDDAEPFMHLSIPKTNASTAKKDQRKPFTARQIVSLLHAARAKGDSQLANLIELAMWSGARIEELCSLKLDKVGRSSFQIEDAKTEAGWREVPIHSKLKPTIQRLREATKDGYLLSGLTSNKYGDRSNAIGKRFGHLKAAKGFGRQYVFHCIRKTVATLLENAGVPENISADIMGHDKPTMTYGLYSGGASLATKRDAIEKLSY